MKETALLYKDLQKERNRAKQILKEKQKNHEWAYKDSTLLSDSLSFNESFKETLPSGFSNIKEYIEIRLAGQYPRRALEIGGPGSTLFSEFTPGFFSKTVGITLKDERSDEIKIQDAARNHFVVEGDILDRTKQEKVESQHERQGFNVIVLRMLAGQNCLPADPFFMSRHADFYYQQLADLGIMLIEIPDAFSSLPQERNLYRDLIPLWVEYLEKEFPDQFELQLDEINQHLRLEIGPGAPRSLPFLPIRTVLAAEKQSFRLRQMQTKNT